MSDFGINFRATSGYVTDPANTTYCISTADAYPTTRGGFTFGRTSGSGGVSSYDLNNTVDPRLAGTTADSSTSKITHQLDLVAGNYDIQLALGDVTFVQSVLAFELLNNTTSLFTISSSTSGSDRFVDALGAKRVSSWVPSSAEAKTNQNISTGTLVWTIGDGISANTGEIAHIRATSSADGGPTTFLLGQGCM